MRRLFDPLWVSIAVLLSAVVAFVGYPAFEDKFGSPQSVLWTLACVGGVWVTYVIRAYLWSEHQKRDE